MNLAIGCPTCGEPLSPPTVRCSSCGIELHRACSKKTMGRWYCRSCYKGAKREAMFERMAQRAAAARKPGKLW